MTVRMFAQIPGGGEQSDCVYKFPGVREREVRVWVLQGREECARAREGRGRGMRVAFLEGDRNSLIMVTMLMENNAKGKIVIIIVGR